MNNCINAIDWQNLFFVFCRGCFPIGLAFSFVSFLQEKKRKRKQEMIAIPKNLHKRFSALSLHLWAEPFAQNV
jgi:hypothetical protein